MRLGRPTSHKARSRTSTPRGDGDGPTVAFRAFFGLLGVLVITLAVLLVVAILSGGYHPDPNGGLDPIRMILAVIMAMFGGAFAFGYVARLLAWLRDGERVEPPELLAPAGLIVLFIAIAVLLWWWPDSDAVQQQFQTVIFVGLALMVAALAYVIVMRLVDSFRRRDWLDLAVSLVVTTIILYIFVQPWT
jgi:peptidoglycan/LPS O-acetylase OafA/YrhL